MSATTSGTPVFQILCSTTDSEAGWTVETSAAQLPKGVLIQTVARQENADNVFSISVALEQLEGMRVVSDGSGGFKLAPL